jgi:hypothetical protein
MTAFFVRVKVRVDRQGDQYESHRTVVLAVYSILMDGESALNSSILFVHRPFSDVLPVPWPVRATVVESHMERATKDHVAAQIGPGPPPQRLAVEESPCATLTPPLALNFCLP